MLIPKNYIYAISSRIIFTFPFVFKISLLFVGSYEINFIIETCRHIVNDNITQTMTTRNMKSVQ